jgi:thioredoxin reductase (NADPH)
MKKNVAIIGAGPAGMAAALQLQRFGIKTILFEAQSQTGSLLKNAWRVENYLGMYPGRSGANLLQIFRKNLALNKIKMIGTKVESLDYDFKSRLFKIKTRDKKYSANYAIVATGTKPKIFPLIENAEAFIRPYLFYEVFPILKKRHKTVIIIGAGDAAFDNALNLAKNNKVIICNRSKSSSALPLLIAKAAKHAGITYYQDYKPHSISPGVSKNLNCVFAGRKKHIAINADYLVAATGHVPQKDFYADKLKLSEQKLIKSGQLFLIGDIKNNIYRQVAIAVGDGILAAMCIFDGLKKQC